MYYLVYKIVNLTNQKYYIGAHKTYRKDDGYEGSGSDLIEDIAVLGIENFSKEILFEAQSEEEMLQKEFELVKICPESYNKIPGGRGYRLHKPETIEKIRLKANKRIGSLNSQYGSRWITNGKENRKLHHDDLPEGWRYGRVKGVTPGTHFIKLRIASVTE